MAASAVCNLIGRVPGCSFGRSFGLIGRRLGRLLGCLLGCLLGRSIGCPISRLRYHLVGCLLIVAGQTLQAREAPPLTTDVALEARVMQVAEELRCLVCQNETIAASQADLAVDLRQQIRTRLARGESQAQILDFMVQRYGAFVRYRPAFDATTVLLWLGPFVLLASAAFALARHVRRHQPGEAAPMLDEMETRRADELLGLRADR